MALAYTVETLEGLDQGIAALYKKGDDGRFTLDVTGHEKPDNQDKDRVPLSRLSQEVEKRRSAETQLKEIVDQLIADIDESKRSIIPDLAPGPKIAWLRNAQKMGFFDDKQAPPIDSKRPSDRLPTDQTMNPVQRMATGYKK